MGPERAERGVPTWQDVVAIATRYPGVEEGTSYGKPALRASGKAMCRMRTDPDALVMKVIDLGEVEALTRQDPQTFFTTPHYDGYPYVLVRLDVVGTEMLEELVEDAWRLLSPKRMVAAFDAGRA